MGQTLEDTIGALNGLVGDYLARTGNGLATPMQLVPSDRAPSSRVVVLVHGLMCTDSIWRFKDGSDYGARLAADLDFSPVHVRYNSGLPIPDNGAQLAVLLQDLLDSWPVPVQESLLIGFSMGGLVLRSACHVAHLRGHAWLTKVQRAIYIGTPHRGAPLERAGRVLASVLRAIPDPVTQLLAELGELRSDGIKDLGDADVSHEDRARRACAIGLRDPSHPVPLLAGMEHYLIAGSVSRQRWLSVLFGDAIVPVSSATDGRAALPPDHVRFLPGVPHLSLAHHPEVYGHIRTWCEPRERTE